MTLNQIKIKYDEFFGTGLWERDYKPHITVFAEQCVRQAEEQERNVPISNVGPSLLDKVKEIAFGDGSAQERMVDIKALFSDEA